MKRFASAALAALTMAAVPNAVHATAQPYTGEIYWVGETFCPRGTTEANGQLLLIAQHTALFSLYGTIYGGDGRTTFALPDLRDRVAIGAGQGSGLSNYRLGQRGGAETATMTQNTMPNHGHTGELNATSAPARSTAPNDASLSQAETNLYSARGDFDATLEAGSVVLTPTGSGQSFTLMKPFTVIRACVVLDGQYPTRP